MRIKNQDVSLVQISMQLGIQMRALRKMKKTSNILYIQHNKKKKKSNL